MRAANLALQGVQKEALAGQRTTLDVLNAQQDLMTARARLINAQRDRVIASYTLLARSAGSTIDGLALNTPTTIRRRITSRYATPGTGCARRRDSRASAATPVIPDSSNQSVIARRRDSAGLESAANSLSASGMTQQFV